MKYMLSVILMIFSTARIMAANGELHYETAQAMLPPITAPVTLTTSTLVLVSSPTLSIVYSTGQATINWYSHTLINVASSSAAFVFAKSTFTAPASTTGFCDFTAEGGNSFPLGVGTVTNPFYLTVQCQGYSLWGFSCGGNAIVIKDLKLGR